MVIFFVILLALMSCPSASATFTYQDQFDDLTAWTITETTPTVTDNTVYFTDRSTLTSKDTIIPHMPELSDFVISYKVKTPAGATYANAYISFGAMNANNVMAYMAYADTQYYLHVGTPTTTKRDFTEINDGNWHTIRHEYYTANRTFVTYTDGVIRGTITALADMDASKHITINSMSITPFYLSEFYYSDDVDSQPIPADAYELAASGTTLNMESSNYTYSINVTRPAALPVASNVSYTFTDGTAINGINYLASNGTLQFNASQTFKLLDITIIGSNLYTTSKGFNFALSAPTNGVILGLINQTNYTIIDYNHLTTAQFNAVDVNNESYYITHKVNWAEFNPYPAPGAWSNYSWEPYMIQAIADDNVRMNDTIIINITSPDNYYYNTTQEVLIWKYDGAYPIYLWQNNSSDDYLQMLGFTRDNTNAYIGNINLTLKSGNLILDQTTSGANGAYALKVNKNMAGTSTLKVYVDYPGQPQIQASIKIRSTGAVVEYLTYPDDFNYFGGDVGADILIAQTIAAPIQYNCNFNGAVYTVYQNGTTTNLTTLYPGTVAKIEITGHNGYAPTGEVYATAYTDLSGHYNFNVTITATGNQMYCMNVSAPNYQDKYISYIVPFSGNVKTKNWQLYPVTYGVVNPPEADFIVDTQTGMAPLTVHFQDRSTNTPTSWLWDFGDGSTSAQQNPTHTYMGTGQFTVKLTVWSTYGSSGIQRNNYISTLGAITFNGYCLDYTSSLAIDGATIKIIDSGGATVGTTTSTALGYYSITVNAPFSSIYALEGSKTDYQTVTYTGLLYPIIFTNGVLSQDVYFFAVNTFPTPGPTTPAGTTDSNTLSSGDKQAAITASVDYWANGILLLAVLLFIGIIMAIFGRMTG